MAWLASMGRIQLQYIPSHFHKNVSIPRLYGRHPPHLSHVGHGLTTLGSLEEMLQERDAQLDDLKFHLMRAQKIMKHNEDKHRRDVNFIEGDGSIFEITTISAKISSTSLQWEVGSTILWALQNHQKNRQGCLWAGSTLTLLHLSCLPCFTVEERQGWLHPKCLACSTIWWLGTSRHFCCCAECALEIWQHLRGAHSMVWSVHCWRHLGNCCLDRSEIPFLSPWGQGASSHRGYCYALH